MLRTRFARFAAASVLAACALPALAQSDIRSPVVGGPTQDGVREVTLDAGAVEHLRGQVGEVRLTGFPMPDGGAVELILEQFDVLAPDAPVVLGTADGDIEIGRPEVTLFRGTLAEDAESVVFLSFSSFGTHGVIRSQGSTIILTSGPVGADLPTIIADMASFPEPPDFAQGWSCNVGPEHINPLGLDLGAPAGTGGGQERVNPCRIVRVAVEGDYEYSAWLFGGDVDVAAAYSITLLGAVSEIYTRDFNVRLVVPFIRLWEDENDPYDGDKLGQFRIEWNANMGHVQRDLAHLLSGNYGGGVAWVSVLCNQNYGYGLSGVGGSFPYPLRDHDGGNWDPFVVSHELGHNFGTLHTHDGYTPPIDDCGNGDCSEAYGGTIMSYCHICSGGMTNIVLGFHPRVIDRVSSYMDSVCDLTGDDRVFVYEDEAVGLQNMPLVIDVLANDLPLNCSELTIASVSGTSQFGGTVEISEGTGEGGRDEVRYTPAQDHVGADRLFYTVENPGGVQSTANVYLDVLPVHSAVAIGASRPGLAADYYALDDPDQLPDFSTLSPYASGVMPDLNIADGFGPFAGSGTSTDVGAVFESAILIPETGLYVLSIDSDDGSKLYLGGDLVIDNDGVHTMQEQSVGLGLEAGFHRVGVEYFQFLSRRGLIVRIEGPGVPRQPIPGEMWRNDRCVADWSLDGQVNTIDFLLFLADWNLENPDADLNADGLVNTPDVILFLNAWVAGCP